MRLRVVNLLRIRSLYVSELQRVLGIPQPDVSRQLTILRTANLVRAQRRGARVRYSLSRAPLLNYPLREFLNEVAPSSPELQRDLQKLADIVGDVGPRSEELSSQSDPKRHGIRRAVHNSGNSSYEN